MPPASEKLKEKDDTFVEKLVTQIIKNVQVTVRDIHIRYEDQASSLRRGSAPDWLSGSRGPPGACDPTADTCSLTCVWGEGSRRLTSSWGGGNHRGRDCLVSRPRIRV